MMIIVYDGLCNFCNGWARFVMARDRRGLFYFATTGSVTGAPIVRASGMDPDDPGSIILVDGDRYLHESDAVLAIVAQLDGPWPAAAVLRLLPKVLRDYGYSRFARRRYALFGRCEACPVPPPELRERFLP